MRIQIQHNNLKKFVAAVTALIAVFITVMLVSIVSRPHSAGACTPTIGVAEIRIHCTVRPEFPRQGCLDNLCRYEITEDYVKIGVDTLSEEEYISLNEFGQKLGEVCLEDTSYIQNNLISEVESVIDRRGMYSFAQIGFLPNNSENLSQLESEYNRYNECSYHKYREVDNWLVTEDALREYCEAGVCKVFRQKLPVEYMHFLVNNPSPKSVYYFLSYSWPAVILSVVIIYALITRKLKKFTKYALFSLPLSIPVGLVIYYIFYPWYINIPWFKSSFLIQSIPTIIVISYILGSLGYILKKNTNKT